MFSTSSLWTRLGNASLVVAAVILDLLIWGDDSELRYGGTVPNWVIPLATASIYSLLIVRRRHPITVFAILWAFGLIGLIVPGYEPFFGLLVALYAVARRTSTGLSLTVLIAT